MPRPKRKILSSARSVQEIPKVEEPNTMDLNNLPSHLSNLSFSADISPISVNNNNYVTDSSDDFNRREDYIPLENLKLGKVIGEGEFGSVLRGTVCLSLFSKFIVYKFKAYTLKMTMKNLMLPLKLYEMNT